MSVVVRIVLIVAIWLALWSDLSAANVVGGLLVAAVVVTTFPRRRRRLAVRPLWALAVAGYFLVQLVQSSVIVAIAVLVPSRRVHTGIIAVPLRGASDPLATLIADAISLTPGTLSVDVSGDPRTVYVHALDVRDPDTLRRDLRRLEVLAVRAFGSADAVAGLVDDDTTTVRDIP